MVTQTKPPYGTQVDFTNGFAIPDLQRIGYPDEIVGVLGYQNAAVTIDSVTRDGCLNGDVNEVATQVNGQGMVAKYITISWNETLQQNGSYLITDFRVGLVFQTVRSYNTGPAYAITAMEAIPWLKAILSKIYVPWKAWSLITFDQSQALLYRRMYVEQVGQPQWVGVPIGQTPPDPPDTATIRNQIFTQGDFNSAFGKFTTDLVSKGYTVTYPPNGYGVDVCYYKSPIGRVPGSPYYTGYYYIPYVRFWWDFSTVPDFTTEPPSTLIAFLTAAFLIALAKVIAVIVIATVPLAIIAWNLSYKKTEIVEMDYVRNADGSPYIDPATGKPVFYPKVTKSDEGQPIDWNFILTIVGLGVGAGVALYLYNKSYTGREKK